ncbi:MAG: SLBB domain-containing protein, partial [Bacteroidota bacterium]
PDDMEEKEKEEEKELGVFGQRLFKQKNLSFAPNLNIPTPKDYVLGPGDEILIEVYGASQESYALTINPEGWVRINNLGPVRLSGLTIEKARERLKNRLSNIYSGMKGSDPNTFAEIALGNLRSISVNVTGEVNMPGSYTLPSFATVFNALYLAAGPNENGSFRKIKLVRENDVIARVDLYDFLLSGIAKNNIRLQDQDIVFVEAYDSRVSLKGEVKRPAIYEIIQDESLADLIGYAGGFSENAFRGKLTLTRNTPVQKKIIDVNIQEYASTPVQNGDIILVGKILSRFENRVSVKGAVYREGDYQLREGMTLAGLIEKAQGLSKDVYLPQASLYRLQENMKMSVIPVDLEAVITGQTQIDLQAEDMLYVSSIFELEEELSLKISGEVQKEGEYPFYEGVNLGELIRMAGGLKESASLARLEVARRLKNREAIEKESRIAEVFTLQLPANLSLSSEAMSFKLEPNDVIFIRRSPGYEVQQLVSVEGEISFPGKYSLANNRERLSDLIKRSGGLTGEAYPPGATLFRKTEEASPEVREKVLTQLEQASEDTLQIANEEMDNEQAIGIDLPFILANPGSPEDLLLKDGDRLQIPTELQTVRLSGALLYPVTVKYEKDKSISYYIANAGGFNENALRSKTYVLYANGSVDRTRSFLGIRDYPKVEPGAEIIVPRKPEKERVSAQQAISISSAVASMALVLVTLIGRIGPS